MMDNCVPHANRVSGLWISQSDYGGSYGMPIGSRLSAIHEPRFNDNWPFKRRSVRWSLGSSFSPQGTHLCRSLYVICVGVRSELISHRASLIVARLLEVHRAISSPTPLVLWMDEERRWKNGLR